MILIESKRMQHSDKELAQQVFQYLSAYGIKHLVISPGSRNAPLIIESNAYPDLQRYSIVDERSAAFFGLGIALKTKNPVALICTSGSALLNYYPAVAEAFYANVPLLVISADRPEYLIDIGDGQTIRQPNVFAHHTIFNANLKENFPKENLELLKNAFEMLFEKQAPVHINVPFSEPLYDTCDGLQNLEVITPNIDKLVAEIPLEVDFLEKFAQKWNRSSRKMLLVGATSPDEMLTTQLLHLTKDPSVIIFTETTSNVYHEKFINHIDRLIFPFTDEDFEKLKPEILLTIGGQVVSKKIKALLRKNPALDHWHVDKYWKLDTYHILTQYFNISPTLFFSQFFFLTKANVNSSYQAEFLKLNVIRADKQDKYISQIGFSDLKVYQLINRTLNFPIQLVFSNSAAIRYAQFFNWSNATFISCNRGTSGIDGSTSTAIGIATQSALPTVFITGDLSFFYDSNALWNNYLPKNFKIILVNNRGGGIFRFIPGPTTTNTLDFFETPHQLTAEHLCQMYHIDYHSAANEIELENKLTNFLSQNDTPQLLEIFTPTEQNALLLAAYFKAMRCP